MTPRSAPVPPAPPPLTAEDLDGDLIRPGHPLFGLVWSDPARLSGAPCFAGTRVPVRTLFDHVEAGDDLATLLDDFPGVSRQMAVAVLESSWARLFDELGEDEALRG